MYKHILKKWDSSKLRKVEGEGEKQLSLALWIFLSLIFFIYRHFWTRTIRRKSNNNTNSESITQKVIFDIFFLFFFIIFLSPRQVHQLYCLLRSKWISFFLCVIWLEARAVGAFSTIWNSFLPLFSVVFTSLTDQEKSMHFLRTFLMMKKNKKKVNHRSLKTQYVKLVYGCFQNTKKTRAIIMWTLLNIATLYDLWNSYW